MISLSPLDSVQIAKMVRELSSRHALPRDIVEGVSARTGGVPLFVEEVTRLLLERGEQGGAQAIPPTLQQSLAARLDRLGSARETAQIGAVLGRGFSYALLQSVAGLDEGALRSSLERLAEADILFVEGDGAQATYCFKHALIQDAAYDEACSRAAARRCMPGRPIASAKALRPNPRRSRIISRKPASTISPSNGGARQATRPFAARRSRRRSPISARRSPWRTRRRAGQRRARRASNANCTWPTATRSLAARLWLPSRLTDAFARARESARGGRQRCAGTGFGG